MLVKFDDTLQINIPEMDEQHKKLVDMLNHVYEFMSKGLFDEALDFFIKEIVNYVEIHFKDEEEFMEKIGYPDIENHKKIHLLFKEEILRLIPAIQSKNVYQFRCAVSLSWGWLYNHIAKTDRKYANFALKNGLISR